MGGDCGVDAHFNVGGGDGGGSGDGSLVCAWRKMWGYKHQTNGSNLLEKCFDVCKHAVEEWKCGRKGCSIFAKVLVHFIHTFYR